MKDWILGYWEPENEDEFVVIARFPHNWMLEAKECMRALREYTGNKNIVLISE